VASAINDGMFKWFRCALNCEQYPMAQPWRTIIELRQKRLGACCGRLREDINGSVIWLLAACSHQLDWRNVCGGLVNRAFWHWLPRQIGVGTLKSLDEIIQLWIGWARAGSTAVEAWTCWLPCCCGTIRKSDRAGIVDYHAPIFKLQGSGVDVV